MRRESRAKLPGWTRSRPGVYNKLTPQWELTVTRHCTGYWQWRARDLDQGSLDIVGHEFQIYMRSAMRAAEAAVETMK